MYVMNAPAVRLTATRSTESDSEVDGRGGGGASHGTAAELEQAQGGVERSRFSPGRIAEFKKLAADPRVYEKVGVASPFFLFFLLARRSDQWSN